MLSLRDQRYHEVKLNFNAEFHKYKDSFGNPYKSMTTVLGELKPEFDRKYWLRKKSLELGTSERALAKQWQDITDEACARGNVTHDSIENAVRSTSMFQDAVKHIKRESGEMITVADLPNIDLNLKKLSISDFIELTDNKYPEIYRVLKYYVDNGYNIYAEIGAFLIDYLISGTIDILCIRDDRFVIGDWKTNRGGLKFTSGYYEKDKTQTPHQVTNIWKPKQEVLLAPVSNLPSCNGSIYNLQLSGYAKMVELILGIPNAGLWLCHIDSDFELNEYGQPKRFPDGLYRVKDNPVEKVTLHKMKYLKNEIELILADRLRVVNATKISSMPLF